MSQQRVVELLQTPTSESMVGRPRGVVERVPGCFKCVVEIVVTRIGSKADDLFGRRIDVVERSTVRRVDQLAVDEHPRFGEQRGVENCCHANSFTISAAVTVSVSRPDRNTVPGVAPLTSPRRTISTPLTNTCSMPFASA